MYQFDYAATDGWTPPGYADDEWRFYSAGRNPHEALHNMIEWLSARTTLPQPVLVDVLYHARLGPKRSMWSFGLWSFDGEDI